MGPQTEEELLANQSNTVAADKEQKIEFAIDVTTQQTLHSNIRMKKHWKKVKATLHNNYFR